MKPLLWTPWRKGFASWSVPPWWNATAAVLRQQRRFPRRRCPPWRRRPSRPRWRPRPRRKRWSFSRRLHGLQVITTWFDSLFDSTSSKWFFEKHLSNGAYQDACRKILGQMQLPSGTTEELLQFFEFQRAEKGTILWKVGDDSDFAFLLVSGNIGVVDDFQRVGGTSALTKSDDFVETCAAGRGELSWPKFSEEKVPQEGCYFREFQWFSIGLSSILYFCLGVSPNAHW